MSVLLSQPLCHHSAWFNQFRKQGSTGGVVCQTKQKQKWISKLYTTSLKISYFIDNGSSWSLWIQRCWQVSFSLFKFKKQCYAICTAWEISERRNVSISNDLGLFHLYEEHPAVKVLPFVVLIVLIIPVFFTVWYSHVLLFHQEACAWFNVEDGSKKCISGFLSSGLFCSGAKWT